MSSTKWNTAEQWGKDHVLISSTETTEFALRSKSQALGSGFILHLQSRLFFSRSVMSDSLQPHWLQHARLPCPSPTPRACSNTCRSVESVIPSNHLILCCLLLLSWIFPCIRVFSNESALCIRWPKYWSFSISPVNIQGWFPLGLTGLISLLSKGFSRIFSSTTVWKHQFFGTQPFFMVQLSHLYMTTRTTITFD